MCLLGCMVPVVYVKQTAAQTAAGQVQATQDGTLQTRAHPSETGQAEPGQRMAAGTEGALMPADAQAAQSTLSKHTLREAEDAYLDGAKKLQRDDLIGAERQFKRAEELYPQNRNYAIALSVARQHQVLEMVQQAGKARLSGNQGKAEALLAQARAIDPRNPLVLEHSGMTIQSNAPNAPSQIAHDAGAEKPGDQAIDTPPEALADRARMISASELNEPWKIHAPAIGDIIELQPSDAVKSFHMTAVSTDLIREVASAYGIRAVIDASVVPRIINFELEHVNYKQAMSVVELMANVITVPLDETSMLVARNLPNMQRLAEETIYLPESSQDQINEIASVARSVFMVRQATTQVGSGSIVVRAPQDVLPVMNKVIEDLMNANGEVMLEVKMLEVTSTRNTNGGTNIPTAAGIYNVDQAATALVNANQSLVQQAIAQGLVSATASNLTLAAELIGSGLVQSSLLNSTIGAVGGGTTLTGITETGNLGFALGMNSSETKVLDDVQIRVSDRQPAVFREGSRYPIVSSTYSSGVSTAASALGHATINGVSLASLLSQYAGGSSVSIPQVTYEDLGITLNATPTILKSGRVRLSLDMKIEALSGSTNDGNPILENRAFKSDITVGEGESALLVSDVTKTETSAMSGIPGLSELPGFQMPVTKVLQKVNSQLVLVVTPHVVRRRSDMVAGPRIAVPRQTAN